MKRIIKNVYYINVRVFRRASSAVRGGGKRKARGRIVILTRVRARSHDGVERGGKKKLKKKLTKIYPISYDTRRLNNTLLIIRPFLTVWTCNFFFRPDKNES